jgi:hypothetical protein
MLLLQLSEPKGYHSGHRHQLPYSPQRLQPQLHALLVAQNQRQKQSKFHEKEIIE